MNLSSWLRCLTLLAVLVAPLVGCGGGGTPDAGPTGKSTPPVTPEMIKSVEDGKGAMGPGGAPKK